MKTFFYSLLLLISFESHAQKTIVGTELGLDGYFSLSNISGILSVGAKYGLKTDEHFIFGPSIRYQRLYVKNIGEKYTHNLLGGGVFAHYRFYDYLFAGAEIEFFKSSTNYYTYFGLKQTLCTFFVGGGFSHDFNNLRINAGIFYDVIDSPNSPFRLSYAVRNNNGALLPFIYRIGIFIPLS